MKYLKKYNESVENKFYDIDIIEEFMSDLEDQGFTCYASIGINSRFPGHGSVGRFNGKGAIGGAKEALNMYPDEVGVINYRIKADYKGGSLSDKEYLKNSISSLAGRVKEFTSCQLNSFQVKHDTSESAQINKGEYMKDNKSEVYGTIVLVNSIKREK